METTRRIVKEFWLPTLVAIFWTLYNFSERTVALSVKDLVNVFSPTFFIASWATGQFFRVRKQALVDRNLSKIEDRVAAIIEKLEKHTKDFVGYNTGEGSIVTFMPMLMEPNTVQLALQNLCEYPVFDVFTEVIDLDEKIDPKAGKFWRRHEFKLNSLYPQRVYMNAYKIDFTARETVRLNAFIHTRTSSAIQQFRMKSVNGSMSIAIRTDCDGKVTFDIPNDFPGYNPSEPEAIFK